jgi:hypothetical protein
MSSRMPMVGYPAAKLGERVMVGIFLAIVGLADLIVTGVNIASTKKSNDEQKDSMDLKVAENTKSANIVKFNEDRNFKLNLANALVSAIKV